MTKIVIETDQEIESLTINFVAGSMKTTTHPRTQHTANVEDADEWEEPLDFHNEREARPSTTTGANSTFGNAPASAPPTIQTEPVRSSDSMDVDLNDLLAPTSRTSELPAINIPDVTDREIPADAEGMSDEDL